MDQSRIARRSNPRYELEQILQGYTQYSAPVRLLDLSATGALLEHRQYLKPGEELVLNLQLGGSRYKVRCTVVHCSIYEFHAKPRGTAERAVHRVGVKFLDFSMSGRKALQDLIKERLENERREQPRLFLGRTADLQEFIQIRAVNLGRDGGLFTVPHPLEAGSEHEFVFQLPKGEVRVRGTVRHCQTWSHSDDARFQIGVKFGEFDSDGLALIVGYLADLERKPIEPERLEA
jgi:hypothetical protein